MTPSKNFTSNRVSGRLFAGKYYSLKSYLLLLLILLVAYAPVSTFYFAVNNDAFSDNLPNKYFLSEAIHSRMLPLWNPYMNFGFPVYADMGFAFWNPITWLFAVVGYNAYTLTAEMLLYVYLAGAFMYKLTKFLKFNEKIGIIVGAMYMCSGFFVGCLQYVNFLTGAAFLPLLLMSFLSLLQTPSFTKSIILSLSGYMVFAGGHPAIPLALVYFMFIFSIILFFKNKEYVQSYKAGIKFLLAAVLLFLLIASPSVYSYSMILDTYSRYSGQQNILLLDTGFNPLSYLSFLFPLVTIIKSGVFSNDIAMRSAYIGVVAVFAVIVGLKSGKKINHVFILTGLTMLILCAGGDFKQLLYNNLPLLTYVRTNGEYRIFPILCFCLSAGFGLQHIFDHTNARRLFLRYLSYFKFILLSIIALLAIIHFSSFRDYVKNVLSASTGLVSIAKSFYDKASFSLLMLTNALVAFIIISLMIEALNKKKYSSFLILIVIDIFVHTILYFPATGIGLVTLRDINNVYENYPASITIPELVPVNSIDTFDTKTTALVGDASYYNKKIGTVRKTDYPSFFTSTENYFNSMEKDTVSQMPYLFLKNTIDKNLPSVISVKEFRPASAIINVVSQKPDTLVFLQNNYKFWKASVNGTPVPVLTMYATFMGVPVEKGKSEVAFCYEDTKLKWFILLSLTVITACIVYITKKR